jgi:tRNA modification GTPase
MAAATDTIFALATAPGRGGIAVLRLSGPASRAALMALAGVQPVARRATPVTLRDPATGETVDRGLALLFAAPASYTGEDVVELHVHGGRAVVQRLLGLLDAQAGLRPAEAGEFTRRAFEHGKLDLTQAEAVADMVAAETEAQRRQALRQLDGALGRLYEDWRARLVQALAYAEADIDFADEDLPAGLTEAARGQIRLLREDIAAHLRDRRAGEILRDGFQIAIVGAPNAGKSSILNALAKRDAAIVDATAGTTRDIIELRLDLGGYPAIVADTAGLRDTADAVEGEGVRRAHRRARAADLLLVIYDATKAEDAATRTLAAQAAQALVVRNKCDLLPVWPRARAGEVVVSARAGTGMAVLEERLAGLIAAQLDRSSGAPALTRLRHRRALEEAVAGLDRALAGTAPELVAEDLRLAARAIGRVTGRVDVEDLLDVIFRDFCIGK